MALLNKFNYKVGKSSERSVTKDTGCLGQLGRDVRPGRGLNQPYVRINYVQVDHT
jgi:hypothetical protein